MLNKNEIKPIIMTALPLMAAFLAERGMEFIDTIMMGWIGPIALAAGALSTAFFGTIIIFCMGILNVIGIFIAHGKGSNDTQDIDSTVQHGFFLAILLSIPCILVIWWIPTLLLQIGQDPVIVTNVRLLLHALAWGVPGFLLYLVLREFISALSSTFIVMVISSLSIPLTFVANDILIYGKFNFPALGVAGIGYGSAIVMWFMFFCLLIYSKRNSLLKEHINFTPLKINNQKLFDMLRVGISSGLLFLLEAGMFLSTAIFMGYFGEIALASHQIAMQSVNIAYTIPIALSIATSLKIGHAMGEKNLALARRLASISFYIALFISLLIALLFTVFSHVLIDLFLAKDVNNFLEIEKLANSFLHIAALFLCFDAMQSIANGSLRGMKDTFIPMLLSIGCYWVLGIGCAYLFSMHMNLGPQGIWYGLTLGLASTAILLMMRFFRRISHLKNH